MNDGDLLGTHLHAQVAARHHHAIGDFQNGVEIFNGFGLFELGDHRRVVTGAPDDGLGRDHVGGGAHEADRDVVRTVLECKTQILAVLRRE